MVLRISEQVLFILFLFFVLLSFDTQCTECKSFLALTIHPAKEHTYFPQSMESHAHCVTFSKKEITQSLRTNMCSSTFPESQKCSFQDKNLYAEDCIDYTSETLI